MLGPVFKHRCAENAGRENFTVPTDTYVSIAGMSADWQADRGVDLPRMPLAQGRINLARISQGHTMSKDTRYQWSVMGAAAEAVRLSLVTEPVTTLFQP